MVLPSKSVDIAEFKRNPMIATEDPDGDAVAVLNRNIPVFYAVPAQTYEAMLERLEDSELAAIVRERQDVVVS
jgi:antitoxin StbD